MSLLDREPVSPVHAVAEVLPLPAVLSPLLHSVHCGRGAELLPSGLKYPRLQAEHAGPP